MKIFDLIKKSYQTLLHEEKGMWEAVSVVQVLVAIIVVGAIGISIAQSTLTTMSTTTGYNATTGLPTNANLSSMQTSLLGAGQTGAGFVPVLVIAFIGAIAIAYIFGIFGKKR